MQVNIKQNPKEDNEYKVEMKLTAGAILTLKHALDYYKDRGSAIATDLDIQLTNAMVEAGITP
jgi:hypothetical protein